MKCIDFSVKNLFFCVSNGKYFLFWALFLHVFPTSIYAVEMEGLYQGSVVVRSRDNERERQQAFTEAFRQVLTKVTGSTEVLTDAVVRRALSNADDYVDTWSYRNVEAEEAAGNIQESAPANSIEINVTFFEPEVLSLLDNANIPIWPGNRPYTLVWLVAQDELGARELLGSSSNDFQDLIELLEMEADHRGLPLLLPILDFEDLRVVSANDVWEMDAEKLLAASQRYQNEGVLVIRIFKTLSGDVFGKSNYLFRDQVLELEVFDALIENFIQESVALATEEISSYYAVLLSGTDSSIEVNLTVEGIASAADYAALLDYVTRLTDVNDYQIASVENQKIMLRLSTGGQIRQLVETIALNRTLMPLGELLRNDNQVYMTYQWNN